MEIELIGARVERRGYDSVIRRGLAAADAMLRRLDVYEGVRLERVARTGPVSSASARARCSFMSTS